MQLSPFVPTLNCQLCITLAEQFDFNSFLARLQPHIQEVITGSLGKRARYWRLDARQKSCHGTGICDNRNILQTFQKHISISVQSLCQLTNQANVIKEQPCLLQTVFLYNYTKLTDFKEVLLVVPVTKIAQIGGKHVIKSFL